MLPLLSEFPSQQQDFVQEIINISDDVIQPKYFQKLV